MHNRSFSGVQFYAVTLYSSMSNVISYQKDNRSLPTMQCTTTTVILGPVKRLRGRGGFTVLLPYNTCTGLIFPKKEAAAL